MSQTNPFGAGIGYNPLNEFASMLQGRVMLPGTTPAAAPAEGTADSTAPPTNAGQGAAAKPEADPLDADLLLAASHGVSTSAMAAPPQAAGAAGRTFKMDPPGVTMQDDGKQASEIADAVTTMALAHPNLSSTMENLIMATGSNTAATVQGDKKRPAAASVATGYAAGVATGTTEGDSKQGTQNSEPATSTQVSVANKKARRNRSWDELFGALVSFKAVNGHCNIPVDYREDPELGLWVREQQTRRLFLSPEERYKLDLIGFPFEAPNPAAGAAVAGQGNLAAAAAAAAINPAYAAAASLGALSLPAAAAAAAAGPLASRNIFSTLERYKQQQTFASLTAMGQHPGAPGILASLGQASLLGAAATAPTAMVPGADSDQYWNFMFQQVEAFFKVHGQVETLATTSTDPSLRLWILQQKSLFRSGTMPEDRKAKLQSINLVTDADATTAAAAAGLTTDDAKKQQAQQKEAAKRRVRSFDENFNALLEYKKAHGNVDVPQKYDKDRKLGIWVKNVRQHPNRHSEEQRARLDAIGFKWRKLQLDDQWNDAFKQLIEYRDKYGDCNVPSRWKTSPALARWVHTQRTMYRRNKLLDERKEKLEEAGFVWDCNAMRDDEAFHENYEKLVAFKNAKGHCNIPNKYRRDRPLGRWASKMRDLYVTDQLDADRKKALNDIGFSWTLDASGKKKAADGSGQDPPEDDGDLSDSDSGGPVAP